MAESDDYNKKVIEEVTKDVSDNLTINEDSSTNTVNKHLESDQTTTRIPEDLELEFDSEEQGDDECNDFIDEEKLKDLESTLSEEEKLERHKNALQHKIQGNEQFKKEQYLESITSYTNGLKICPLKFESDRSILYANRGASKAKLDRKESAIEDCTKAIELNGTYVRAYLRRAKLYEETDKLDDSLSDYMKINELDPGNKDAVAAQVRLPPLINERNEKLKKEMMSQLKDLGNVFLKPFGLSSENFKFTQDPNTGGYSVNFSQGT